VIYRDRNQTDKLGNNIRPSTAWFERAMRAQEQALVEKERHQILEDIYTDQEVKISLEKLFNYKCAYCENSIEESGWNVEHFRPKGRVAERVDHTGYYWLAYTWENLFPSCTPCNQKRKDPPTWDERIWGITGGKVDHFPIRDENKRVMTPEDNFENEEPLLINPCVNNPENYFVYDILGNILAVNNNDKAFETIKYFNLKRKRLKRKRAVVIKFAIDLVEKIGKYKNNKLNTYKEGEKILEDMLCANNCYFAASARCVKNFPQNFGIKN